VLGEQLGSLVRHVGHDGPYRPGRQRAVERSRSSHGKTTQAPGAAQYPGGLASGHGGVIPQPGGHGGSGIGIPQLEGIELAVGHAQLGAEAISRPLADHQLVPVEAQLQAVDRLVQLSLARRYLADHSLALLLDRRDPRCARPLGGGRRVEACRSHVGGGHD
jgi:hypothetical protein